MTADEVRSLFDRHTSAAAAAREAGIPASTMRRWFQALRAGREPVVSCVRARGDAPSRGSTETAASPFAGQHPRESFQAWGLGGPARMELGRPRTGSDYTGIGIFDLHGQWREPALFAAQLQLVRDVQPDFVAIGGDALNFDIISRWQDKILKRLTPLQILREIRSEIEDFKREILSPIRDAAGNAIVFMVEGNHDDRLRKYLSDDLHEAWAVSREWLGVDDYLDGYYTRAGVFVRDRFLIRHGDTTAQNPAKKEYQLSRCSGWTGHLHRCHQHFEPPFPLSGERFVHTIAPASCRLDANYGAGNAGLMTWHQGCLVGTFSATDAHDHATDVGLWRNGRLLVRGMRY